MEEQRTPQGYDQEAQRLDEQARNSRIRAAALLVGGLTVSLLAEFHPEPGFIYISGMALGASGVTVLNIFRRAEILHKKALRFRRQADQDGASEQ